MPSARKSIGAQFLRIEHYAIGPSNHSKSRKGRNDVSFVVREFLRAPSASLHVASPLPPLLLLGDVDQVRALPARLREGSRKVRSSTGRRQRIDCPVLMPIIFSHPSNVLSADYLAWEKDTLAFVQRHFAGKLEAVARHADESHLHLHALIHDGGRRVAGISPGHTPDGKRSVKALKKFQDLYHEEVGKKHKLTRVGPRRQRILSTKEHKRSVQISAELDAQIQRNQAILKQQQQDMETAAVEEARLSRQRVAMMSRIAAETTELQFLMAKKVETEKCLAQREADLLVKERDIEQLLKTLDEHEMSKVRDLNPVSLIKRLTRSPT